MAKRASVAAPLEELTHMLAGAVAQDLSTQQVAIVKVVGSTVTFEKWTGNAFGAPVSMATPVKKSDLENLIDTGRGRVFVVHLSDPLDLPAVFAKDVRFDRIVYVTDAIPKTVGPKLKALLDPTVNTGTATWYSSVVASVLGPPQPGPFPPDWPPGTAAPFEVQRLDSKTGTGPTSDTAQASRLFRDACRVGMDGARIAADWNTWNLNGRPNAFVDAVSDHRDTERAHRWARAATNRRVGVAVSGGGASAYRAKALFEQLESSKVPVDVVAGLSGGGVVGAYYCQKGNAGLDEVVARGTFFQFALPVVIATSWPLELIVDFDLGSARVQDADIRFAPVTTELPAVGAPHSTVVSEATMGAAVRASGCLPPAFAPFVRHGNRYTDGGAAAIVPARIVRDCGADLAVACNIIPGAARSNPLDVVPVVGQVLHDWTPLGRVIDIWTWYTYMWSEASRAFGEAADVYVEFEPTRIPFVECFLWFMASTIVDRGRADPNVPEQVAAAKQLWTTLQNP